MNVLCCVTLPPLRGLTKYAVVGTGPTLTVGVPAVGPGDSQALFSPGHQRTCTESQDRSGAAPGPAVGAARTPAWPSPACTCPQSPRLLKPGLSAEGALVHSDVQQELNL